MKIKKFYFFLSIIFICTSFFKNKEEIQLKYNLKENDSYFLKMKMEIDNKVKNYKINEIDVFQEKLDIKIVSKINILKVDNEGNSTLRIFFKDISINLPKIISQNKNIKFLQDLKGSSIDIVHDIRGKIKNVKGFSKISGILSKSKTSFSKDIFLNSFKNQIFKYPKHLMTIENYWDRNLRNMVKEKGLPKIDMKAVYTIKKIKENTVEVDMITNIKNKKDTSKKSDLNCSFTGKGKGKMIIDKKSGWVNSSFSFNTFNIKVKDKENNNRDIVLDIKTKIESKKL